MAKKKRSKKDRREAAKNAWATRRKKYGKQSGSVASQKAWDKRKDKYGPTGVKGGAPAASRIALKAWDTRRLNELD